MVFFLLHYCLVKITPSAFSVLTKVSKRRKISNEGVIFSSLFMDAKNTTRCIERHNVLCKPKQRVV